MSNPLRVPIQPQDVTDSGTYKKCVKFVRRKPGDVPLKQHEAYHILAECLGYPGWKKVLRTGKEFDPAAPIPAITLLALWEQSLGVVKAKLKAQHPDSALNHDSALDFVRNMPFEYFAFFKAPPSDMSTAKV